MLTATIEWYAGGGNGEGDRVARRGRRKSEELEMGPRAFQVAVCTDKFLGLENFNYRYNWIFL